MQIKQSMPLKHPILNSFILFVVKLKASKKAIALCRISSGYLDIFLTMY
jgi:hypothetical protein